MRHVSWKYALGFGVVGVLGFAHGCAFNPFDPPHFDEVAQPSGTTSTSAGGANGNGGHGGDTGTGGLAGQGGNAGSGGSPCMCDGDDSNDCTKDVVGACPGGDIAKCHEIEVAKPCGDPANKFICNLAGSCESTCLTCTDEPGCTARCEKLACTDDVGCASGFCEQGVCCHEECAGPCQSCNREGTVGECQRLPLGLQTPGCTEPKACNASAQCVDKTGAALGAGCNVAADCMSLRCIVSACVSAVDEVCAEDLECITRLCDPITHKCKPCMGSGALPCREGSQCYGSGDGVCKVFPGEPSVTGAGCVKGTITRFFCALPPDSTCTRDEECDSRYCKGGKCAPGCNDNSGCAPGFTCDTGWHQCSLPTGARCIPGPAQASACKSGKCSGFPPRCE